MFKRSIPLIALVSLLLACNQGGPKSATSSSTAQGDTDNVVLATVNGKAVTEADIEQIASGQLRQARMDMYAAQKSGVDQIINQKLIEAEAAKQGISIEELNKREISGKISITDDVIEDYYNQRKARFQGKKFDEVKGLIRGYMYQQKFREARGALIAKLRKDADIKFLITPPRVEVAGGDHPGKGPEGAPVKIIEFSDYQCPFCGRARETVNQIITEYGEKVHYVFRDFPLSFHKEAQKAHEAAHCAREQGKYWEYNDRLFKSQKALSEDALKKYAKELKLKQADFESCLSSDKYAKLVQDSLRYGQSVGVSGTPAFFINGRMLSGARPFPAFKEVIDDELSRAN